MSRKMIDLKKLTLNAVTLESIKALISLVMSSTNFVPFLFITLACEKLYDIIEEERKRGKANDDVMKHMIFILHTMCNNFHSQLLREERTVSFILLLPILCHCVSPDIFDGGNRRSDVIKHSHGLRA